MLRYIIQKWVRFAYARALMSKSWANHYHAKSNIKMVHLHMIQIKSERMEHSKNLCDLGLLSVDLTQISSNITLIIKVLPILNLIEGFQTSK